MVRLSLIVIARAINLASSSSGLSFAFQGDLLSMNDDGSLKWRWAPSEWELRNFDEGVDGTFYVKASGSFPCPHCYDGLLCALDGADGSVKWQLPYLYKDFLYAATGGLVGIINDAVYMHRGVDIDAIDAETGAVKGTWQNVGDTTAVGPDGSVVAYFKYSKYGERGATTLSVLSQDVGKVKWSFTHQDLNTWAMSEDGIFATVVNSAFDQVDLIYLDGHDGSVTWNVSLPVSQNIKWHSSGYNGNRLSPVLGSNGEVYLNGVDNDGVCSLFAFDASGSILRSMPCFELLDWHLHVTQPKEDGTLEDVFVYRDYVKDPVSPHIAVLRNDVFAYSGTTGNLLWNVSFGQAPLGQDGSYSLSAGQDGTIFVDDRVGHITAIRNGVEAWKFNASNVLLAKNGISYLSQVVAPPHHAFVVVAVDNDGSQMWSYDPRLPRQDAGALIQSPSTPSQTTAFV